MLVKTENPTEFVKRAFFLLWKACGGPLGMGILQDRPAATEDNVFENVCTAGDYSCNHQIRTGRMYGDYVFGRMMKWGCEIKEDGLIDIPDQEFRSDYQGFSHSYGTNEAIVKATAKELGVVFSVISE